MDAFHSLWLNFISTHIHTVEDFPLSGHLLPVLLTIPTPPRVQSVPFHHRICKD